jgi:hypothetical protein
MSIIILPWLIFVFCTTATFFNSRSNKMATDIVSLSPGLDRHGLGLGIGLKWSRKTRDNTQNLFFRCTPSPNLVVEITNKIMSILCLCSSATITDTFTQLERLCPPPFTWFLQQSSHSHYISLPFTH